MHKRIEDEGNYRYVIDNYLVTQAAELSIDMLATIPYHRMLRIFEIYEHRPRIVMRFDISNTLQKLTN